MYIRRPMCFIALVFMLFIFIMTESMGGVDLKEYCNDFTKVSIAGVIKDKAYKNDKNILYIEDATIYKEGKKLDEGQGFVVYLEEQDINMFRLGQKVLVEGKYANFSMPDNEGEFNMRKYYRIHGFTASITNAEVVATKASYGKIRSYLNEIRRSTKDLFFENMSDINAGTLAAMVLGDKTELDSDVKDLFQRAGMAHMLAMSGLHIATVGLFLFSFIRRTGIPLILSAVISSVVMVLYGTMTGLSTSTLRALIMFLLGVIAKCIGRTYDLMSAVCMSAIIILIENPFFIYDSGFLMSVLSVIGIGVIYPEIIDIIRHLLGNKMADNKITASLRISISTTLATLPVVMNSFFKISRYGIFANLIVVPLMSAVLFIGLLSGILNMVLAGVLIGSGAMTLWIYRPLFYVCEKILDFYNYIAGTVAGIDGNSFVTGKSEWWNIALYVGFMLIFVLFKRKEKRLYDGLRIICMIFSVSILLFTPKPDMRINALYVGQGACNVIYGKDLPTIMIDGGSTDVKDVYKYKVKPNLLASGISKIDYLFITHPDEDHISAVRDLINDESKEIKVDKVILSIVDGAVYKKLINNDAADGRGKIYQLNAGQKIEGKKYVIEAISPEYRKNASWDKADANAESLVLKLTHKMTGFTALFTGDIDSETERRILANQNSNIKNISFISIPHHGSRNSSCEEFLKYTNPKICTISAGKHNSYGHPHKETLERINTNIPSAKLLRTDRAGEVSVVVNEGRVYTSSFYK